ncbi:FG-GAP repeat domain-containing protein [Mangrovibacterium lignilyticum]|uniref:FG-GAP repeat domain-containing protein n=1 Tax=Mangrovibacterium lignilyticum TaxID=2668052 RepID=UPI0013CF487C|nr:VCBS repeat-containing protein [Mangrovibacterium lignilyticum]
MKKNSINLIALLLISSFIYSCSDDSDDSVTSTTDLGIAASADADMGSSNSYSNQVDIQVYYWNMPGDASTYGSLRDAIAYLDANHDGLTDVFMATGEYLLDGEVDCILALNDGNGGFYNSRSEFNDDMPPATHARKTIAGDFNNDGLTDLFVFDHGYDANPYPGSYCKLIIQDSAGSFSWSRMSEKGFFHGGAAADIDNDGDLDIFVGGHDPFFYINDGNANFTATTDRFDNSIDKVFTAELIDVDEDGYIDLLVGAHEQDGDGTSIYWGRSTGSYTKADRTILTAYTSYGTVLDFDAADFDNDGDRDLVVNRTGGGSSNFYVGSIIQLLENEGNRAFTDATSQIDVPGGSEIAWFPWLRVQDIDDDGDIDIFPDDLGDNFKLVNDGSGNFTKEAIYNY